MSMLPEIVSVLGTPQAPSRPTFARVIAVMRRYLWGRRASLGGELLEALPAETA